MMKILLTGASGFIGRNLKEAWTGRYDLYAPTHSELDLLDTGSVERYLTAEHFDVVIHAANTNSSRRQTDGYQVLDRNLRMFFNLERCRDMYGKLFYFGSGAEYDMRHYVSQMTEDYFGTHIPQDPYGFSKYIMSKQADRNIYDLRLFGVFGKYEEWERRFISNMIYQNFSGPVMRMNQNMYFDYLYIDDLTAIMEWFLTHEPEHNHYNICTGERVELYALAEIVMNAAGHPAEITVSQEGWKLEYSGSNQRLRNEMGDAFRLTPMSTAVTKMVNFYREHGFSKN